MSLQGKNALVTGGSRGIGRAICLELARQGANVAVNYAGNAKAAQETVEACKALGVQAVAIQADVADAAACEAMVKEVISTFGSLQILVNNAGITRDNLALSIITGDEKALTVAQGIGKKIAQRVILDLKDKVDAGQVLSHMGDVGAEDLRSGMGAAGGSGPLAEAIDALAALGYSRIEAGRAVRKLAITEDMTTEDILKLALRSI